jgi:hypothetical protein
MAVKQAQGGADSMPVLERLIRTVAILASLLVLAGFAAFAVDESTGASRHQQDVVVNPGAVQERQREAGHSRVRIVLDDVNDELLKPFSGIVDSPDPWVQRGVPTLFALLVYGIGLGFLARYVRSRA